MGNGQAESEGASATRRDVGRNGNDSVRALILASIVEGIGEWELKELEAHLAGCTPGDAVESVYHVRIGGGCVGLAVLMGVTTR